MKTIIPLFGLLILLFSCQKEKEKCYECEKYEYCYSCEHPLANGQFEEDCKTTYYERDGILLYRMKFHYSCTSSNKIIAGHHLDFCEKEANAEAHIKQLLSEGYWCEEKQK